MHDGKVVCVPFHAGTDIVATLLACTTTVARALLCPEWTVKLVGLMGWLAKGCDVVGAMPRNGLRLTEELLDTLVSNAVSSAKAILGVFV